MAESWSYTGGSSPAADQMVAQEEEHFLDTVLLPRGLKNIFFVVKVADDGSPNGTAYVVYSDGKDIFLRHSTDKGVTWSQRVRVSDGPDTTSSFFPWMETGSG